MRVNSTMTFPSGSFYYSKTFYVSSYFCIHSIVSGEHYIACFYCEGKVSSAKRFSCLRFMFSWWLDGFESQVKSLSFRSLRTKRQHVAREPLCLHCWQITPSAVNLTRKHFSSISFTTQGLCVATLFCFCNGEVMAQVKRRWRIVFFRPRANSYTATQVSVRYLWINFFRCFRGNWICGNSMFTKLFLALKWAPSALFSF